MKEIDTALTTLQTSVTQQLERIRAEAQRLDEASRAATGGKIMPVEQCAVPPRIAQQVSIANWVPAGTSSWASRPVHWTVAVAAAREELTTVRAALEAQHTANLPALENNAKVRLQVHLIMKNLGIEPSRSTYGYATPRASKMTRKTTIAGFVGDLDEVCKTSDGYEACVSQLERFETRVNEFEKAELGKEQAARREAEKVKAERDKLTLLGAMAQKYACDPDVGEVIDALCERDKYFCLAYWLERNRHDWNDGPDAACRGLSGFTVETEEDRQIYEDINGRVMDWEGDGRTFRDSPYGYDFLYGKADPGLMSDYQKLVDANLANFD